MKAPPNDRGFRIALYVRASTEEQCTVEGTLKNQEERLRAEVRYRNQNSVYGEIVAVYIDAGKSAKDMNRPELQRMLQAIKRKEITLVMVTELSRLSRSVKDFVGMNDFFREHGCKFASMKDQYDTSTAGGEMVMLTMANLAQFERRQVSERVSANFKARSERGLYNGGQVPMGYKLIPEKRGYLAIDPEFAPSVRLLFETFLREGTTSRAARWMNQNGYRTRSEVYGGGASKPRVGHFTFQNVYQMLMNETYCGVKTVVDRDGSSRDVKACWEPIVDRITFERAQILLKSNKTRKRPDFPNRFPFLLSGRVYCEECQASMVGKTANGNGGKIGYYDHAGSYKRHQCMDVKPPKCTHMRVQAVKLEKAVWEAVEGHLRDPHLAKRLIEDASRKHANEESKDESSVLKQKITHFKRRLEGLAARLADFPPDLSPEPVFDLMRKTGLEVKEAEARLAGLSGSVGSRTFPAELRSYLALLAALVPLDTADPVTRGKIIELLVHRIAVTPDGLKIAFYVGDMEIEWGLASAGPRAPGVAIEPAKINGSKVLLNGGP